MRTNLLVTAAVLGLSAPLLFAGDHPVVKKKDAQRDLLLVARLTTPQVIYPGHNVGVVLRLENRSTTTTYKVVKAGDGSESGWREPHIFFTAKSETKDGEWKPVEPKPWGRCGMYDANWHDEVVEIAPGGSLELKDWVSMPSVFLTFQDAGRVKLRAHYAYKAKGVGKSKGTGEADPTPEGVGPMKGVEPFEIVSEPVELTVVRPFDVLVKQKAPLVKGKQIPLSQVLDVRVKNLLDKPLSVDPALWSVDPSYTDPIRIEQPEQKVPARKPAPAKVLAFLDSMSLLDRVGPEYLLTATAAGTVRFAIYVNARAPTAA